MLKCAVKFYHRQEILENGHSFSTLHFTVSSARMSCGDSRGAPRAVRAKHGRQTDRCIRTRPRLGERGLSRLPEADRDGYIRRECEDDDGLRKEVGLELLKVLRSPDDEFLERGPSGVELREADELHVAKPHDYTLIRQLSKGGMGVVSLAVRRHQQQLSPDRGLETAQHRAAGQSRDGVALPVRAPAAGAPEPSEHRSLVSMPGALSNGRPFLRRSDYINGTRIDKYCNAHALSVVQRLQVFMKICAALQYAHEQLVIHRDLKPANVLVTEDGKPKLLDFGIARQLASPSAELTSTMAGQRIMTLAYASPEQIEGQALSTATDVYSLGVVLYQLLTGTHPVGRHDQSRRDRAHGEPVGTGACQRGGAVGSSV